ncbi:hypothetical protein A6A08_07640 [Nocardiopsis sp. TSRI0078]|uniref:hypothetical protein n=1 Tax=unclassified Nocardiopsis TaxID=2649073 RepID=UPI00093C20C1|nr:hypothetical protein [Nocardiopsis sp. TSRI0078]OKI17118.1 hypothetical protein A6A08_07640 [Nocardiopsis sp. TSRI0078]
MTPIRLTVAAALALLVATGCGPAQETAPAAGAAGAGRTPAPTDHAGPRPRDPGSVGGLRSAFPGAGGPVPEPAAEPLGGPADRGPGEGSASRKDTSGEGAPEEAVAAYVAALSRTGEPERMREGLELTAEDSTARTYLAHRAAVARARADGGDPARDTGVERTGDGYELCPAAGPTSDPACTAYGGFTARAGLITGLLVNGRDPGPGLLAPEGVEAGSEGVRATLLTAYQSVTDKSLVVTAEFTADANASLDLPHAVYQRGEGREVRAEDAVGRYELDAGGSTHAAFSFPGAIPGGTLRVSGCLEECSALVDIALPVR